MQLIPISATGKDPPIASPATCTSRRSQPQRRRLPLSGPETARLSWLGLARPVPCEPGVEHWHGATAARLALHVAIVVATADHPGTVRHKPVAEDVYAAAQPQLTVS